MKNKNNLKKGNNKMNETQKKIDDIDDIAFKVGVDTFKKMIEKEGYYVPRNRIEKLCNKIIQDTIKLNGLNENESKGILLMYILKTRFETPNTKNNESKIL